MKNQIVSSSRRSVSKAARSLKRSKTPGRSVAPLAASVASLVAGLSLGNHSALAATVTWVAAPGSANWADATNWGPGTVSSAPGATSGTTSADIAYFNIAQTGTNGNAANPIFIDANRNISGIYCDAAVTTSLFIGSTSGNALYLTNGGQIYNHAGGTTLTVNAPLIICGTSYKFSANNGGQGNILLGGSISSAGSAPTTITVNGDTNGAMVTIAGLVSNGASSSLGFSVNTDTVSFLNPANSFTGGVAMTANSKLIIGASGSLFGSGTLTLNGAVVSGTQNASSLMKSVTANNPIVVAGDLSVNNDWFGFSDFSLGAGPVTLTGGTRTINVIKNTMYLGGSIGDGGSGYGLTMTCAGQYASNGALTLTGSNTYTGATTVNAGTLTIGGTGGVLASSLVTVNAGSTLVYDNGLSAATSVVSTSGTNVVTVASTTGLYAGLKLVSTDANLPVGTTIVSISGTTLTLSANALATGTTSDSFGSIGTNRLGNNTITLNGGSFTFNTQNGSTASVGTLALAPGVTSFLTTNSAASGTSTLTINSISPGAHSTLQANMPWANGPATKGSVAITTAPALTGGTGTSGATLGIIPWAIDTNQNEFLTTLVSSGTTYLGPYNYLNGTHQTSTTDSTWVSTDNVKLSAGLTLSGSRTINSLSFPVGAAFNLGGNTLTLNSGGLLLNNSSASVTNGTLTSGTANPELFIHAASNATISANISDNSGTSVALTKAAAGTLILTGSNSYTGLTTVGGGTLQIGTGSATPIGNLTTNGVSVGNGATLLFNTTVSGTTAVSSAGGNVTNSVVATPQTISVTGSNTFTNISGAVGATVTVAGAANSTATLNSSTAGFNLKLASGTSTISNVSPAGNLEVDGGYVTFIASDHSSLATAGQTFLFTGGTVAIPSANQFRFGGNNNQYGGGAVTVTGSQTGGLLSAPGGFLLGNNDTSSSKIPSYTLSGGTFSAANGFTIEANTNGTGASSFTLSGSGKLLSSTPITGQNGASAHQNFVFNGGTLAVTNLNMTNLTTSGATTGSPATLLNNGGTLAPGDIGTTGLTSITGNYTQASTGTLAIDLGGTTVSGSFQDSGLGKFDKLTVSGTTSLAGNLAINILPGFAPGSNTFSVLASTGTLSATSGAGSFQAGASQTVVTNEGFSSMLVTTNTGAGGSVVLSGYSITNQWQGGGGNWGTGTTTNWTGGTDPNGKTQGAYFGGSAAGGTVTLDANRTLGTLVFNNAGNSYTLAGSSTLTLQSNNASVGLSDLAGTHTIATPVALNSGLLVAVANATDNLTVSGNISGGANALTMSGSGTLRLSGVNTFGSVTVSSGTLQATGTASLPTFTTTGATAVGASGVLAVNAGGSGEFSAGNLATLLANTTFASGALLGIDTSNAGGSLTYPTAITGNVGLIKLGGSTLVLGGSSTNAGAMTVLGGTVQLGGSGSATANPLGLGTVTVNSGATLDLAGFTLGNAKALTINSGSLINSGASAATYSAAVTLGSNFPSIGGGGDIVLSSPLAGNFTWYKTGADTVTLSGSSIRSSGAAVVSSGVLQVTGTYALGTAPVTFNGGTLAVSNSTGFVLGSNNTVNANSSVTVGPGSSISIGTVNDSGNTLTFNGAGNVTQSAAWGNSTGGITFGPAFTGTATLNQTNAFTGALTVKSGFVSGTGNGNAFGVGGTAATLVIGDTTGSASATVQADGRTFANPISVPAGNTGTLTLQNATNASPTFSGPVALNNSLNVIGAGTGSLTLSGLISGSGSLTTSGSVILSTVTVFTGNLTVSSGTLKVPGSYVGLNPNAVTLSSVTGLDLNGNNEAVGGLSGAAGLVTNTGGAKTLTLAGSGTYSYGGLLTATTPANMALTVALSPAGVQTLTGSNSYTGATTIGGGTLSADAAGVFGPSSALTIGPGTLRTLATGGAVLGGGTAVSLTNGTIQVGNGTTSNVSAVLPGVLSFNGADTINMVDDGSTNNTLVLGGATNGLVRTVGNPGNRGTLVVNVPSAARFNGTTGDLLRVTNSTITTTNGIMHWSMLGAVSGTADFLTVASGTNIAGQNLKFFTGYTTAAGSVSLGSTSAVYEITGNSSLSGSPSVYAMKLDGGVTLSGAGTISGLGGIILNGGSVGAPTTLSVGTLNGGGGEIGVYTGGVAAISSNITSTGGGGNFLTLFGPGTLTLTGTLVDTTTAGYLFVNGPNVIANTPVSFSNNPVYVNAGSLTLGLANQINGTAGAPLTVNNSARVDLHGYSQVVTSLSGTGTIDNTVGSATLTFGNDNSGQTSGLLRNTGGTLAINKVGTGEQTFVGNNTYSGATNISAGTLNYAPVTAGVQQSFGALNLNGQEAIIESTYAGSGTNTLTFASLPARTPGSTRTFMVNNGNNGTTNKIAITGQAAGFMDQGTFVGWGDGNGGSEFAWYDAAGYVRGINYGVDPGSVYVNTGTTSVSGTYVNVAAAISAQTTGTMATLKLNGSPFSLATGATLTVNGIEEWANNISTISGGTLQAAQGQELVLRDDYGASVLTINTAITDNAAGGSNALAKSGQNLVVLNGANTYSGLTSVNSGKLSIGSTNAIPMVPGGAYPGGFFVGVNTTLNVNTTTPLNYSGGITNAGTVNFPAFTSGTVSNVAGSGTNGNYGTINYYNTTGTLTLAPVSGTSNLGTISGSSGATVILAGPANSTTTLNNNLAGFNLKLVSGTATLANNTLVSNLEVDGGYFAFPYSTTSSNISTGNQSLVLTGGTIAIPATPWGLRYGGSGNAGQSTAATVTGLQTGGLFSVGQVNFGGSDTSPAKSPSYTLSGGTFSVGTGGFSIGADTAGSGSSTFTLSGSGKLLSASTIGGSQGAGARQNFVFNGGTLAAAWIDMTKLTTSGTTTGVAATLTNNGGTLAPGDLGTSGYTGITGGYTQASTGTLAIDLGGTTASGAFQDAANSGYFDKLTVTGTATMGGTLAVNLINGTSGATFVPSASNSFTILTGGTVTGAFASGTTVSLTNDPFFGTMAVNITGNSVYLNGYQTGNEYTVTGGIATWGSSGTSNWTKGVDPSSTTLGAKFGAIGGGGAVALDQDRTVGVLLFDSTNGYILSGANTLTLQAPVGSPAGITVNSGTHTITTAVTLASNLGFSGSNGTQLIISGNVSGGSNNLTVAGGNLTLAGNNTYANTTISSGTLQIGNGGTSGNLGSGTATDNSSLVFNRSDAVNLATGIAGTGALIQAGPGQLTLTGSNSYSGATTVSSGTLQIGNGGTVGSIGATSGVSVASGATLVFNRTDSYGGSFTPAISGSGGVVLATGTLTLTGNNSNSGGTTVNAGILNIGSGSTVGTLGAANSPVTINGASLNFAQSTNSTNAAFANNFTFNNGSIVSTSVDGKYTLGSGAANTSGTNTIAVNGVTTFEGLWDDKPMFLGGIVTGTGAISVQRYITGAGVNRVWGLNFLNNSNTYGGAITTTGTYSTGGGGIVVGGSSALQYASVVNNTTFGGANGAGIVFNVTAATLGSLAGSGNMILTANTDVSSGLPNVSGGAVALTVGGNGANTAYSGVMSGSGSLTKAGSGAMTLTGSNTYSGATAVNSGTLQLGDGATLGAISGSSAISGSTGATLVFNRSDAVTIANAISGDLNFTQLGSGTTTLSGSTLASGSGTGTVANGRLVIANSAFMPQSMVINAGATLELSVTGANPGIHGSIISGSGTLVKSGTGGDSVGYAYASGSTFIAMAAGGLIDVQAGSLSVSTNGRGFWTNNLGSLNIATGATVSGAEGSLFVDALTGSGTLQEVTGFTSNETLGVANGSGTFSGNISTGNGTINIAKVGTGTQVLSGSNTYSGSTAINGGVLQIGAGGTTGSLASSTAISGTTGATLTFNRSDSVTVANTISGGLGFQQSGAGTLTLSASNSYSGGTTVNNGTLKLGNASALGSASGALNVNGGTLDLNGKSLSVSALSGSAGASITSTVSGTSILTATVAGASAYAGNIANGAGVIALVKSGTGTLTLTGSNSHSGGTTINGGTLSVNADRALGTATASVTINDGATLQTAATFDFNASRNVILSGSATIDTQANNNTIAGPVSASSATLVKQGSGTLILGCSLTMAGLNANAGAVQLAQSGSIGAVNVAAAATVSMAAHSGSNYNVLNVSSLTISGFSSALASANSAAYTAVNPAGQSQSVGVLTDTGRALAQATATNAIEPASPEAVPEPGALGLLLAGASALLGFRRKARKSVR